MTQASLELRRLVGKFVLFLALCWLFVLIGGVTALVRGAPVDPVNVVLALLPGLTFVPAVVLSVRLHLTSDRAEIARLWPRALILGAVSTALLIGVPYLLYVRGFYDF